ncbi:hypothetical protein RY831_13450 [Noviherbaspirillum sp. CPCC 100848]|uniref:Uncharacterized protein n=1 Tax=Noviherbaspirillum album TaxID=3080276 RepID=A0ABU6J9G2_9BURK|nr:hypothetical protein [Noviherbaspirillum sp. CPCC 100848]MEC4720163.1 hypothetical protein [Noviherbaspirillum sp. CPCC 100848]
MQQGTALRYRRRAVLPAGRNENLPISQQHSGLININNSEVQADDWMLRCRTHGKTASANISHEKH